MAVDSSIGPDVSTPLRATTRTLGNGGLYIGHPLLSDQLDEVMDAACRLPQFTPRDKFAINLLSRRDVRDQYPLSEVAVDDAQKKLRKASVRLPVVS